MYHEYASANGKITRRNGSRLGYEPAALPTATGLQVLMDELKSLIGKDAYYAWACSLGRAVVMSNKLYTEAISAEIERLTECTCRMDATDNERGAQLCPACRRIVYSSEIPF